MSIYDSRVDQITRCMDEIARCRDGSKVEGLPALIGEMDWLEELHRLVWEAQ